MFVCNQGGRGLSYTAGISSDNRTVSCRSRGGRRQDRSGSKFRYKTTKRPDESHRTNEVGVCGEWGDGGGQTRSLCHSRQIPVTITTQKTSGGPETVKPRGPRTKEFNSKKRWSRHVSKSTATIWGGKQISGVKRKGRSASLVCCGSRVWVYKKNSITDAWVKGLK